MSFHQQALVCCFSFNRFLLPQPNLPSNIKFLSISPKSFVILASASSCIFLHVLYLMSSFNVLGWHGFILSILQDLDLGYFLGFPVFLPLPTELGQSPGWDISWAPCPSIFASIRLT